MIDRDEYLQWNSFQDLPSDVIKIALMYASGFSVDADAITRIHDAVETACTDAIRKEEARLALVGIRSHFPELSLKAAEQAAGLVTNFSRHTVHAIAKEKGSYRRIA